MKVKIADIAREAGVSRATVSRVLNGSGVVNARSVALVQRAIDHLGYVRPSIRPGPKSRAPHPSRLRTGTIAMVVLGQTRHLLEEPAMACVMEEIQLACRKRGISLIFDQMLTAGQIPLCVQARQVDGVLAMMTAGSPSRFREFITNLSTLVPTVHLFGPGHSVPKVDHVTANDVAVGSLAFQALQKAGCRSLAVVDGSPIFHEALVVRGRAFKDRAALHKIPAHYFARRRPDCAMEHCLPHPLTLFTDFAEVAEGIKSLLPAPTGIFLTLEMSAPELHQALVEADLFGKTEATHLIIAGTTPRYVGGLDPAPSLIDICLNELITIAIDRLIDRVLHLPHRSLTMLAAPRLVARES